MICQCGHDRDSHVEEPGALPGPCLAAHPRWGSRSCPDPECPCPGYRPSGSHHDEEPEGPTSLPRCVFCRTTDVPRHHLIEHEALALEAAASDTDDPAIKAYLFRRAVALRLNRTRVDAP